MSRIKLSPEQEAWLAEQHSNFKHHELAAELGVCVDTLKRMLMRRGLQYFAGAKYQFKEPPKTWTRPCSRCGCKKKRPKFQYRCDPCHELEDSSDDFFEYAVPGLPFDAVKNYWRLECGPELPIIHRRIWIWGTLKRQRAISTKSTSLNTSMSLSTEPSKPSEHHYRAEAD